MTIKFASTESYLLYQIENLAYGKWDDPNSIRGAISGNIQDTFSPSNFRPVRDFLGNPFYGTNFGVEFTDIDTTRDMQLTQETLRDRASQTRNLINALSIGNVDLIVDLLIKHRGVSEKAAKEQARAMMDAISDNNPMLISSLKEKLAQLTSTIEYIGQMIQSKTARNKTLTDRLNQTISGFNNA